MKSRRSSGRNS